MYNQTALTNTPHVPPFDSLKPEKKQIAEKEKLSSQAAHQRFSSPEDVNSHKGCTLSPLGNKRVKKLKRLVCNSIQIDAKDGFFFSITHKDLLKKIHAASHKKGELFVIGGKAADIIDVTNTSKDIDFQHRVPVNTEKRELNRLLNCGKQYFVERSGKTEKYLIDNKIIKIVVNTRDGNLFYTLKFRDGKGMKYDVSIVSRLARDCLFEHDVRKIPIGAFLEDDSESESFDICPVNPLNTGNLPAECRKKKELRAPDPTSINFPGCLRLFSLYAKGWLCAEPESDSEEGLDKVLTDSFVSQWKRDPRNDLRQTFKNLIKDHHDKSYADAVAYVFNLLSGLERHSHRDVYERARENCLEVLKQLSKKKSAPLVEPLNAIENALFTGSSLKGIQSEATLMPQEAGSGLLRYKVGNLFLLTCNHPVQANDSSFDGAVLQEANIMQKTLNRSDRLRMQLSEDRSAWESAELYRFVNELSAFCSKKNIPADMQQAVQKCGSRVLTDFAYKDMKGKDSLRFYRLLQAKCRVKLDRASFTLLCDRSKVWLSDPAIDSKIFEMLHSHFNNPADSEQQLLFARTFLEKKSYAEAKKIADGIPENKMSGDICLKFIEIALVSNSSEALKLFTKYQNTLLRELDPEIVRTKLTKLIDVLLKIDKMNSSEINMLMEVACNCELRDGKKWELLLLKALRMSENTGKKAIHLFSDKIIPKGLANDDPQAYFECWKAVLRKMAKRHDERLKLLIADPAPILAMRDLRSNLDLKILLDILVEEAFYCLRKSASPDYQKYYDLLVNYGLSDNFRKSFIEIYISSPRELHFFTACEKLKEHACLLEYEELESLCEVIEGRKSAFSEEMIQELLIGIVTAFRRYSPKDFFLFTATVAVKFPAIRSLVTSAAEKYLHSRLYAGNSDHSRSVFQDIMTLIDVLINKDYDVEGLVWASNLLLHPEFSHIQNDKCREQLWQSLIILKFRIGTEGKYNEKRLVESLEFFCTHFHHLFNLHESEHICLAFAMRALNDIFKFDLALFIEWKNRIWGFLSEQEDVWMNLEKSPERQIQIPPATIESIRSYQFNSRCNLGMNLDDRPYVPPSGKYVSDLRTSRIKKPAQWFRFARGMIFMCEFLLRTEPLDVSREDFLLNMTVEILEILMLGDAHLGYEVRGIQGLNIPIILEIYLKRKGYLTISHYLKQSAHVAHLFSCAYHYDYVNNDSKELFFFKFFLDMKLIHVIKKNPLYIFETEIHKGIRGLLETGNMYHLIRIISIMIHFSSRISIPKLSEYEKYIGPIKMACALYTEDYGDADGINLSKTLHGLLDELK